MTTIRILSEKISLLYARGNDKYNHQTKLDWREVRQHLVPVVNRIMGMQLVKLKDSDLLGSVSSGMAFRYNCAVLERDGQSYIKLPAYPVSLPNNLGIYSIRTVGLAGKALPICPMSMWDIISPNALEFEGNVMAVPMLNNEVEFTGNPGQTVTATLIVSDPEGFGDNDPLPVPADYEALIVGEVLKIFVPEVVVPKDIQVNENTNDKQ